MFSELTKTHVKVFTALLVICISLEWVLVHFQVLQKFVGKQKNATYFQHKNVTLTTTDTVVIGLVSCQAMDKSLPERLFYGMEINEEAVVTIKSILISARLYGVRQLDFHIFVEKKNDSVWFLKEFAKNNWVEDAGVNVSMYFHSAVEIVPDKFKRQMVYHIPYRCGFVRMFFPSALPDVDSIIYLDTDMMVTGNIAELWNHLHKMENGEVIGIPRNNEPENNFVDHMPGFGDILPLHEKAPKGFNSGVLVMNLTKMRENRWQERFLRIYEDFSKLYINMEDQRTLNLFAYFDPGQIHLVPCQFDIMHTNCDFSWICALALDDPYGIHVVHGAGNQFEGSGSFKNIFHAYQNFSRKDAFPGQKQVTIESTRKYFIDRVARPLRDSYKASANRLKKHSKCYGTLDKLLYKNFDNFM